jgi:hypothetical protein
MFNKTPAATADMAVLPGVLGCRILRRTGQVRLGSNPAVPRDGFPVARPFLQSRGAISLNMRVKFKFKVILNEVKKKILLHFSPLLNMV